MNEPQAFLNVLETLLGARAKDTLYVCIRDLVEHGLDLARFAAEEPKPQRQDITQYLAAWSRHAGLSEEESSAWLVEYCATVLVVLSRRTPAAIRHSTKSNLRYIYRSAVPFICHGANSPFRAHCCPECPVYADMEIKRQAQALEMAQPRPVYVPPPIVVMVPVKVANREQFQQGMRFAIEEVQKGTKLRRIVELLNERGLKTKTGRPWTYGSLRNQLEAVDIPRVPPQTTEQGANPSERTTDESDTPTNTSPASSGGD
jgi:hypothetical protein